MFHVRQLKILLLTLLLIPTASWLQSAFAQAVSVPPPRILEAEGRVQAVHDDYDLLDGTVDVGDRFVVRVAYEIPVSPAVDVSGETATYAQPQTATVGMQIVMGERVFVTDPQLPFSLEVRNGNPPDTFVVRGSLEIPADLQNVQWQKHAVKLALVDDTGAALEDTKVPTQLRLEDWSRANCRMAFVRTARFTAVNYHPATSVVITGVVEKIRVVEQADELVR